MIARAHPLTPAPQAHGQLCYVQIPALDAMRSAVFYENVFGWRVERPHPSFEAPGMIGQWTEDRLPARDLGPLLWIAVNSIDDSLRLVTSNDGEIVEPPRSDEDMRLLAVIRDPAGNAVGLAQHDPRR